MIALANRKGAVAGQDANDVVVLPRVVDDPVFTESLDVPGDPVTPEAVQAPKVLGNDPHEFGALYMRHRWSFVLHARRFLSDQRDIDEVVQEGFLKLFLAMPELDNELQALAYARRTITNLCIDRYRADQRRPRLVDLEHVTPEMLAEDDEVDPLVAAEDAAFVREALAQLSPLHREALIKREIEEKPLPQIAAELDIPVEQVKHVLHRARRALRRLLVGTYVEPGVNLDLAAVLAANRARAAAAGKPMGAAVIALVLLLAGVLGLRGSQGRTNVAEPSHSGAGLELGGEPTPQHGVLGSTPSAPVLAHPPATPAAPAPTRTTVRRVDAPVTKPRVPTTPAVKPPSTPVVTPATSGGSTVPPVVVPPVAPPPPPPTTGSSPQLKLVGLLAAEGAPQINATTTFTHPSGDETAFSRFVATTTEGPLAVAQTLTRDSTGAVIYTADPQLPVEGQAVGATLAAPQQAVTPNADGTVSVSLATSFSIPVTGNGPLPSHEAFTVHATYAPDLVTVIAEEVRVGGGIAPPAPDASATPDLQRASAGGGDTVRPDPSITALPSGRENPAGRDQEPLMTS